MCLTFGSTNYITNSETAFSIVTGGENAQFPLSNLKHTFTTKVFRSTSDTVSILIDTKTTTTKNMFAVAGSTIEGIGFSDIILKGSPTTDFSSSPDITIDVSDKYNFGFKKFDPVSFRYWRLDLTGTGSYAQLSNIFLGEQFGFDTNTLSIGGFEFYNKDNTKVSKNLYLQEFITTYNKVKTLKGSIDLINREEFDLLNYLFNAHGVSQPMWVIYDEFDSSAIDGRFIFSGYYKWTKSPGFSAIGGQLWNTSLAFQEVV